VVDQLAVRIRPLPLLCILIGALAHAQDPAPSADPQPSAKKVAPNVDLKGYDPNGGAGKTLYEVPIDGTIDLGLAAFVERVVDTATKNDVIALKIKTFGGRVDAAVRIRDALLSASATTVAYIDRRAISAGALISLACDTIIMSPGASIGAATPVQGGSPGQEAQAVSEKVVSYMRAEMRATAEAKGRRTDLAEAMVDADIEIKDVIAKDKLLTLTSVKALELKLADDIADGFDEAIVKLNLKQATHASTDTHWAEKITRLLTDPAISSMLMTFGFLGLLMELYSPGFGVGGTIGVTCLALFFLGQHAANLAGMEELILFGLGFLLIMLEVFVVPGFGITGIGGIICLVAALAMAMVELNVPWDVAFELGYVQEAFEYSVIRLAITFAVLVAGAFVFGKYFPGSRIGGWLVFKMEPAADGSAGLGAEAPGGSLPEEYDDLLGKTGTTKSVLRPTGVVDFDGKRVHVLTDGEFIREGKTVEVSEVDGHRVVVKQVSE